jgi:hypothetical protein
MKKFIYVLLIAFSSAMVITSCTEDEVAPTAEGTSGAGTGSSTGGL